MMLMRMWFVSYIRLERRAHERAEQALLGCHSHSVADLLVYQLLLRFL